MGRAVVSDGAARLRPRAARAGRPGLTAALVALALACLASGVEGEPATEGFEDPAIIFDRIHHAMRFETDGTGTTELTVRARPLSEAGVQQLGQVVMPYLESRSTVRLESLRVVRPDGTELELDRGKIQDLPAPVTAAFPVYSDLHLLHATAPALSVGDALEYRIVVTLTRPDTPGRFGVAHQFERSAPVTEEVLEIDVPAGVALRLESREGLEPAIVDEAERRVYRWSRSNDTAETPEDDLPDIELSSFVTWDEVGRWYAELARERAQPGPRIEELAREITHEAASDLERLEALFHHVAREYRYLALALGIARYQPQRASEVLENGYGDCKDKHTLLEALARAVGLEAYPVLISTTRELAESVPGVHQFDHAITLVRLGDELVWLDATSQVTPFRYLSEPLRDKRALVVGMDGVSALRRTPDGLPFPRLEELDFDGKVDQEGDLVAEVAYRFRGDEEYLLRNVFFAGPPAAVRDAMAKGLLDAAVGKGFEIEEFTTGPLIETESPLEARFRVRRPGYANPLSERQELDVYLLRPRLPEVDEEEDSLELNQPDETRSTFRLEMAAGFEAEAPAGSSITTEFASYSSEYAVEGSVLTARRSISTDGTEIGRQQYRQYQAYRSTLRADDRQRFLVRQTDAARQARAAVADAEQLLDAGNKALDRDDYAAAIPLLRAAVEARPDHAKAWQRLGKALVEDGQFEEAVEAMRRQTEADPYLESAFSFLGWALSKAGDAAGAEAAYRRQLEIYPLNKFAHLDLGRLLEEQGRCEEAIGHLEKAVSLDSEDRRSKMRLGGCLLESGQVARGESMLRELLEVSDSDWELGFAGHRALGASHYDLAISLLTRAIELDPGNAPALYNLGEAYNELGRLEEAIVAYQRHLEIKPGEVARYRLRATEAALLVRDRRCLDAIPLLEELVEESPSSGVELSNLTSCLYNLSRTDEALAAGLRALEVMPEHPGIHLILGLIYSQKADYRRVVEHLGAAAKGSPGTFEYQDVLDYARGQVGQ